MSHFYFLFISFFVCNAFLCISCISVYCYFLNIHSNIRNLLTQFMRYSEPNKFKWSIKIHDLFKFLHQNTWYYSNFTPKKKIICELIPILLVGISSEFPEKMSSNRSKSERMSQRYHRINATRNGKWYSRATNTTVWTIENTRNSDSTKFRCDPYGIGVQWY